MIKPKRSLSGQFLRFNNPETGWEARTFEDLPTSDQLKYMESLDMADLSRLCISLATALRVFGDQNNITRELDETEH